LRKQCTAMVLYEHRAFVQLIASYVYINGHRFKREAGWLCACGMRWQRGVFLVSACTALPD